MDLAYLLIIDAFVLMLATSILVYFFIKDILKERKRKD